MLEYTSEKTANQLISSSSFEDPRSVVDFCAGGGGLLHSACQRWPRAKYFANDVDCSVFGTFSLAKWLNADFLDVDFDRLADKRFPIDFDVILLNPPFSFERTQLHFARGAFSRTRCSIAFAFLFTSLNYLSARGELLAILPTSTLRSERDAEARQLLKKHFKCDLISPPKYDRFPGLDVSTYLLSVRRRAASSALSKGFELSGPRLAKWVVRRGTVSVPRALRRPQQGLHGWIHTTSIQLSRVVERYELPHHLHVRDARVLQKNSLVLPRVGKVKPTDIMISSRPEILSECLIGVTFDDPQLPSVMLSYIREEFSSFSQIYAGTGAPYTTCSRVSEFIELHLPNVKCCSGSDAATSIGKVSE